MQQTIAGDYERRTDEEAIRIKGWGSEKRTLPFRNSPLSPRSGPATRKKQARSFENVFGSRAFLVRSKVNALSRNSRPTSAVGQCSEARTFGPKELQFGTRRRSGGKMFGPVFCLVMALTAGQAAAETYANTTIEDDPLLHSLHAVLASKMAEARDVIAHGSGPQISLDPFLPGPLQLTVREPHGFVNLSLSKVVVEGLGDFRLKDVVTNMDVLRTSVVLQFPDIKVKGSYKLKGYLNGGEHPQSLVSEGSYEATIRDALASWIGRVEQHDAELTLTQASFRTHWQHATDAFSSFVKKNREVMEQAKELLRTAGRAILDRLQKLAGEALERALAHVMGRSKRTDTWFEMYPPAPPFRGEPIPLPIVHFDELTGESKTPKKVNEGKSRSKRQVPCENGETLDEYVDTLLRFGRRLIRFQEPIPFPNTTIKIDDMLTVFLYNGGIRGASNLSRKKNAYVKCTNTSTTLGLVVRLENLRVNAKYRVLQDYRLLLFNGEADVRIREVIVLIQLTQFTLPNGETRQRLDRLKIWKLGQVTVRMRGLGNLTSALSMLLTYQINEDPKAVIPVAEAQVTHVIRQQLANLTIPIFSII